MEECDREWLTCTRCSDILLEETRVDDNTWAALLANQKEVEHAIHVKGTRDAIWGDANPEHSRPKSWYTLQETLPQVGKHQGEIISLIERILCSRV